jgi:hypothetical protein
MTKVEVEKIFEVLCYSSRNESVSLATDGAPVKMLPYLGFAEDIRFPRLF